MNYKYGEVYEDEEAAVGDTVQLQQGEAIPVVACQETDVPMLNIDADQLLAGDLTFIKSLGLTISNPDTEKPVALGVDYQEGTFGEKVKKFFDSSEDEEEDDDDSYLFSPSHRSSSSSSSSGSSFGGFGGGSSFGGFGGGGFGGGGAARGF